MHRIAFALLLAACKTSEPSASADGAGPVTRPPSAGSVEARPAEADAEPSTDQQAHAGHHHHGGDGFHMDFSEVERFARHFDSPDRDAWQKPSEVTKLLEARLGQVIADIGAGTGYFAPYLSKAVGKHGHVLELDVEPNMVEYMRRRAARDGWTNVEPRVVAPDDPKLSEGSVDHIIVVDTWHHIDDRASYAAKLLSALRPSGSLLVVDFTLDSDLGPPVAHRLAPADVVRELESGGFRAEIVKAETLPKQYVVRGVNPR